jgi:hypothetical protein
MADTAFSIGFVAAPGFHKKRESHAMGTWIFLAHKHEAIIEFRLVKYG